MDQLEISGSEWLLPKNWKLDVRCGRGTGPLNTIRVKAVGIFFGPRRAGGLFLESESAVIKRLPWCGGFKNQPLADAVFLPGQGAMMAIRIVSRLAEENMRRPGTTSAAQFRVVAITAKAPQVRGALWRSLMGVDFKLRGRENLPQRSFPNVASDVSRGG